MKLAFVGGEMLPLPAVKGGSTETSIDGITPFVAAKHSLTVISITDPNLPKQEKRLGVTSIRLPKNYYWQSITGYLAKNKNAFDVIHVFNRPRRIPVYKKVSPDTRFVLSLHNEVFSRSLLSDEDGAACINSVETIITVSDYIGRTVFRRFPSARGKLRTVYSGVDINSYQPVWLSGKRAALREKMGLTDKKVILFAGRVLAKKGPHILVEAFKSIVPKYPEAVLLIVGSPWYSDNTMTDYIKMLYKLAEPVKDKIMFTNYVPQADMPDYYVLADVFVCPSQWAEPAGRIHYEAMAAGLPVITTNRGGSKEIVRHLANGIVINDYRNPLAFATALDTILANPGLAAKMARCGRETAEKQYSFERMAKDYINIYEEIL